MTDDNAKIVADILGSFGWENPEYDVKEEQDTHFYIIGLDPGETTGVAILSIDTEDTKALPELVFLDQIPEGHHGFWDYFNRFYVGENSQVVSEKWVNRPQKRGVNHEPLIIEGVEHALWDDRWVVWQTPDMKSLVSDEWLMEQNLWTPGKRHQMDALIHAIVFLRNDGHEGTQGALGEGEGDGDNEGEGQGTIGQPGDTDRAQGDGTPLDEDARAALDQMARERADANKAKAEASGDKGETGIGYDITDPAGKRKKRELDGAFIGYASAEAEAGDSEVSLLDD